MSGVVYRDRVYDGPALVAALHNHARAVGFGLLHDIGRALTREQAEPYFEAARRGLGRGFHVDYVLGRPLKVRANAFGVIDEQSVSLYERDAGRGAFALALRDAVALGGSLPADPLLLAAHALSTYASQLRSVGSRAERARWKRWEVDDGTDP